MRLGVISDVHANIHALRAVWSTFNERGIETVVCLGDLIGYGASPVEVIEWMRDNHVPCTLGASDSRVAFELSENLAPRQGVADLTLEWAKGLLSPQDKTYLRSLKISERLQTPSGRLKFFHGSPEDPEVRLDLSIAVPELESMLMAQRVNIMLCGGTHIPMFRRTPNGMFVNPGSVGLSLNGEPGADCAILDFTGNRPSVELLKIPYDFHAAAFDIITWDLPAVIAEVIKTGSSKRV